VRFNRSHSTESIHRIIIAWPGSTVIKTAKAAFFADSLRCVHKVHNSLASRIARIFTTRNSTMPALPLSPYILTIVLLIGSNAFMTTAWYWHLRFREVPLWQVVLISWGLAFVEYCLAVPANRYGSYVYTAAQLKTIQEVITLSVFAVFSMVYLQQPITWNQAVGFALIAAGAFFVFRAPI
jgi:uncharacterized protein